MSLPRTLRFNPVVGLLSAALALAPARPAPAQESQHYVMGRVTLSATGALASSPRFDTRVTLGQTVPVGSVSRCNDGYLQSAGFWSVLGDQPVPLMLFVTNDTANPGGVILTWTGSASQFDLYRSNAAASNLDPGNLTRTVYSCTTADMPPAVPRIYYQVVPAGP